MSQVVASIAKVNRINAPRPSRKPDRPDDESPRRDLGQCAKLIETFDHVLTCDVNPSGIEQVQGVLMAEQWITEDEAFKALVTMSQNSNVSIADDSAI